MNAKHGTGIEWTHHKGFTGETWNPVTGCSKVSPGCANCYAEPMTKRLQAMKSPNYLEGWKVATHPNTLEKPLRWQKPRSIFVNSMSDLFHEEVDFDFIAAVFGVMAATPQHRYMILTKRPERMLEFFEWLSNDIMIPPETKAYDKLTTILKTTKKHPSTFQNLWPLPNVWLGVTAENQEQADKRIPLLLQAPAAKRFVSIEPMLGAISLNDIKISDGRDRYTFLWSLTGDHYFACGDAIPRKFSPSLDWVIVGGESGPKARPMHPDWVRSIRDQCQDAETPFFFKQWGEWCPAISTRGDNDFLLENDEIVRIFNLDKHKHVALGETSTKKKVLAFHTGKKAAGSTVNGIHHKEIPGK